MNTMNMERLIEQYFDGVLSPAERLDFERLAAGDPALMRSMQAEGSIREVFARDRARISTDSGALQAHLTGMLKNVPGTTAPLPPAGGASSWLGAAATMKMSSIVIGLLGIVGATYFMTPDPGQESVLRARTEESTLTAPAIPSSVTAPAPDAVTGSSQRESVKDAPASMPAEQRGPGDADEVRDAGTGVTTGSAVMTSDTVRTRVKVNLDPVKKDENI